MCYRVEKQLVLNRANLKVVLLNILLLFTFTKTNRMTVAKIHQLGFSLHSHKIDERKAWF